MGYNTQMKIPGAANRNFHLNVIYSPWGLGELQTVINWDKEDYTIGWLSNEVILIA